MSIIYYSHLILTYALFFFNKSHFYMYFKLLSSLFQSSHHHTHTPLPHTPPSSLVSVSHTRDIPSSVPRECSFSTGFLPNSLQELLIPVFVSATVLFPVLSAFWHPETAFDPVHLHDTSRNSAGVVF